MGSKGKRTVYDYLMSIDYGVCHGPVDSINQIWIKDKRVLCGRYGARTDVDVNLPGLFGGDEGEGGPVGTVEIYTGASDQNASDSLASRFDRRPTTMPGYRGLAHLFFRGMGSGRTGWRWTTNNPYLPPAKVNVTRIARTLADAYASIPATVAVEENGDLISFNDLVRDEGRLPSFTAGFSSYRQDIHDPTAFFGASVFDPADYGITSEKVQAAEAAGDRFVVVFDFNLENENTNGTASVSYDFAIRAPSGDWEATVRGEPIGDSYTLRLEQRLPPDATAVEAFVSYRRLDGSYVSREGTVSFGYYEQVSPARFDAPFYETPLAAWDSQPGQVVDLYALGYDQEDIDKGLVGLSVRTRSLFWMGSLGMDEPSRQTGGILARAWYVDADTGDVVELNAVEGEDLWSLPFDGDYIDEFLIRTVPAGARYVEAKARAATPWAVWDVPMDIFNEMYISGPKYTEAEVCPTDASGLGLLPDANPAHIIHETMVNPEWGKGESPAMFDYDSFNAVASALYAEKFGLSLGWHQQSEIEAFVQEILDHISAVLFQHPATGLWTLKLLRGDYDTATLPIFSPANCTAKNRKRKAWGETINEIVVSYTSPEDETSATVSAHNLANIQIQGGTISETRDYYAIRNPFLAQVVADRDVISAGYPLFSCTLDVDRRAWQVTPGSVIKLTWPEDGFVEMVCRVMSVDYGQPKSRKIKLSVVEDIFALETAQYVAPQFSLSVGSSDPAPQALSAEFVMTMPLPILVRNGVTLDDVEANPGSGGVMFFADQDDIPVLNIEAHSLATASNGVQSVETLTTFTRTPSAPLVAPLVLEADSLLPEALVLDILGPDAAAGDLLLVGDSEAMSEIVMLDRFTSPSWSVVRGCWDTVPRDWTVGSRVWEMHGGLTRRDPEERAEGETVTYRFLPSTGRGRLAYVDAADVSTTVTNRAEAPFRPANTQLDGTGFAGVTYADPAARPLAVTASWSVRNRTTEDAVLVRWDADTVQPETGQTVTLRVTAQDGSVVDTISGLSGDTYDIPITTLEAVEAGFIEFLAERDGELSWAYMRLPFNLRSPTGYGLAYGFDFGAGSGQMSAPGALRYSGERVLFLSKTVTWNP